VCYVYTGRCPVTVSNNGDSSALVLTSLPAGYHLTTHCLNCRLSVRYQLLLAVLAVYPRHGSHRKRRRPNRKHRIIVTVYRPLLGNGSLFNNIIVCLPFPNLTTAVSFSHHVKICFMGKIYISVCFTQGRLPEFACRYSRKPSETQSRCPVFWTRIEFGTFLI
jgi:hypothetical protein